MDTKLYSSVGRTEGQVEAPFSWERSMACAKEKISVKAVECWISGLRLWQKVDLEGSHIHIFHPALCMIWSTIGCVTFMEAEYSAVER